MAIEPDTKDWTWVLQRPCTECGTDVTPYAPSAIPAMMDGALRRWMAVLRRPDAAQRPDGSTWSPLEYAAHVSDVCRVFTDRLALLLREQDPTFPDWDQDAAAVDGRYAERSSDEVAGELAQRAKKVSAAFAGVPLDQWDRAGLRSNGSPFTVRTLGQYFAHDVLHHLHDVDG
ncbi:DinB family protein [Georgenia sunbinii]|uniref:DinB family protein n=1 Tax=Georgenia sunbinii TaxID=3117728 RepID=UPI002F25FEEF